MSINKNTVMGYYPNIGIKPQTNIFYGFDAYFRLSRDSVPWGYDPAG